MYSNLSILTNLKENKIDLAIEHLKANIQEQEAKRQGGKAQDIAIIKRLLKDNTKNNKNIKPTKGIFNNEQYNIFYNLYSLILDKKRNFGYEMIDEKEQPLNIARMEYVLQHNELIKINIEKLTKKAIENKATKDKIVPYFINYNGIKIGANPNTLKDLLNFVGTATIYINTKSTKEKKEPVKDENYIDAILIKNKDLSKIGILLPIVNHSNTAECDQ